MRSPLPGELSARLWGITLFGWAERLRAKARNAFTSYRERERGWLSIMLAFGSFILTVMLGQGR